VGCVECFDVVVGWDGVVDVVVVCVLVCEVGCV